MPPKTPKQWPPVARLTLTAQSGFTITVSTAGTQAGSTGQGHNKVPSQLASWQLFWGDTQQESGFGPPPASFSHTYASPVGTTAFIRLVVVDRNTLTAQATLTIVGLGQLPAAPTLLTATVLGPTSIQLAWADVIGNALNYSVERSPHGAGTFVVIATVLAPTVTYTDGVLLASTSYDYRVSASNATGTSAYSNTASATTDPAFPLPSAPSGLLATTFSTTQIDLAWTDNSGGTASFEIQRKPSGGFYATVATVAVGVVAYSDTGLASAVAYTYQVRAVSLGGNSAYSNESTATTQTAAPAAPTNLTATPQSQTSIQLAWTASVNATAYVLERSPHNAGTFVQVANPSGTSVLDTGLTAGTSYDYRVKATNTGGDSPYSPIASATTFPTPPPPTVPIAPSNLGATTISTSQINLAWTDNSTNETNFEVQRKTGAGAYVTIATLAAGVTTYANTGLTSATAYTYRVRATNAVGASAYSNESTATTQTAAPAAPATLTATPQSTTSIQVNWSASTGAVNYTVERSPHSAGTFVAIATVTTLVVNDTGLAPATSYDYRVKASNSAGDSPYSPIGSATTFTPPPPPSPPAAPSVLLATAISSSQINLTWTDNASDETNFQIERKLTAGGTFAQIATVAANVVAYSDVGLTASTSYTYRVRATNAGGNSAYSNESAATTSAPPPPPAPNAPSGLAITNPTQTTLQLSWTDNSTNETGFSLERSVGGSPFTIIQTLAPDSIGFLDQNLTAATTYQYRIRAFNGNGNSTYSNIATGTTLSAPPPPPPTGPTAMCSVSPTSLQQGQSVALSTAGTVAGSSALTSWLATWGDGSTNTGSGAPPATVAHIYNAAGGFTPSLKVTDANALTSTAFAQQVTVISQTDHGGYRPQVYTSYGMNTVGGRGPGGVTPKIIRITALTDIGAAPTLNGDGTYSSDLRGALETATGPRYVIADVAGTINGLRDIVITSPYVTLAGQTAQGLGLSFRNYAIFIQTHDVVLQHVKNRVGDVSPGGDVDGVTMYTNQSYNILIDHCSFNWAIDEVVGESSGQGLVDRNITIWRTIVAQGLHQSPRGAGSSYNVSKGMNIYDHTHFMAVIQCLFAHNWDRNPAGKGDTWSVLYNNVMYDWGDIDFATSYFDAGEGGDTPGLENPVLANIVGNVYKAGPSTGAVTYLLAVRYLRTGSQIYLADNVKDGGPTTINDFIIEGPNGIDPRVGTPPLSIPGFTPLAGSATLAFVLANVGAFPLQRDSVDAAVIANVTNRTGQIIQSQSQVGGWPVLPFVAQTYTVPANPFAIAPGQTFRNNLEMSLESFARSKEP